MMKVCYKSIRRALKRIAMTALLAWEWLESGVTFDLSSDAVRADPYATYERLRRKDPVHYSRLAGGWVLTRYEDAQAVLLDHHRFSNMQGRSDYGQDASMLDLDPPDHTRLRSLVSKAFTPRTVAQQEPRVQQIVDELLEAAGEQDHLDLIEVLAFPLPVIVIAEMIGVPTEDLEQFKEWSNAIVLSLEPARSDEQVRRFRRASEELYEYFEGIIAQRREAPKDDLISALLEAEDEGDKLSHLELLATLELLLVAGNETTRNLIGNGMLALLRNPHEMERLREDPSLLDTAIDELLRYDSPVQLDGRHLLEDVEIGGKQLWAGAQVVAAVGAANRDPAAFSNPEKLDVGREERSHISFGRGIHFCLGAPLALLEARIAFATILKKFSSIRLSAEPEYRPQVVLRGVEALWVQVEWAAELAPSAAVETHTVERDGSLLDIPSE